MNCYDETMRTSVRKEKTLDTRLPFVYDNSGGVMESLVRQSMLYDFYGELLTEHQKKIYEDVVYNDLSLAEIAAEHGISRQGVHDMVRRCNRTLQGYEEKLHLIRRFMQARENVMRLQELTEDLELTREELITQVRQLTGQILEEL